METIFKPRADGFPLRRGSGQSPDSVKKRKALLSGMDFMPANRVQGMGQHGMGRVFFMR